MNINNNNDNNDDDDEADKEEEDDDIKNINGATCTPLVEHVLQAEEVSGSIPCNAIRKTGKPCQQPPVLGDGLRSGVGGIWDD